MLLIILLGLIAKLAWVSGDCDLGTPTLYDFDFSRFSGSRTWYLLMRIFHGTENSFDCFRITIASPEGNRSLVTNEFYHISEKRHGAYHSYVTNWNTSGYFEVSSSVTHYNGRYHVIAIDYDRYVISKHCTEELQEPSVNVGFQSRHPDEETVNDVHRELQENNIDVSQVVEWTADHCQQTESSTAGESPAVNQTLS